MKHLFQWLYSSMWSVKEGWYLRYGNLGWEWLPTQEKLRQMIDDGEIG